MRVSATIRPFMIGTLDCKYAATVLLSRPAIDRLPRSGRPPVPHPPPTNPALEPICPAGAGWPADRGTTAATARKPLP
jgi:hypothetical protein